MIVALIFLILTDVFLLDFGEAKNNTWYAVNDGVMGGRSQGVVSYQDDVLHFEGSVSFENNGGFASVRSESFSRDLTVWSSVTIRYRCDGQSLNFGMNHYRQWYDPTYKVVLPVTNMKWKEVTFALKDFEEYRIGIPTGNRIDQNKLAQIIRFGIMTNDKKEGRFEAEIDFIAFNQ